MPIVFEQDLGQETNIAIWKIDESTEELRAMLQLKSHEELFLNSLQGQKRNLQWLATRVLLRKMLCTNDYIDVAVDKNGKPFLTNNSHHISFSHSYIYATVIISKRLKVGVDIELIKPKIERIASKFLNENELQSIDFKNKLQYLYVCWCAKEAIYKLNGERETSFRDNIHLLPFKFEDEGSLNAFISKNAIKRNFIVHYKTLDNFMLGYVMEDTN